MAFDKKEYHNTYAKEKLKRIPLDVTKEKYEEIKDHASKHSESINGFIKRAIDETMEKDNDNWFMGAALIFLLDFSALKR